MVMSSPLYSMEFQKKFSMHGFSFMPTSVSGSDVVEGGIKVTSRHVSGISVPLISHRHVCTDNTLTLKSGGM